jgi:NDP-sugar pyrophosphorylase family protein
LNEGAVLRAVESDEPWHDLGTSSRYLEGVLAWLRRAEAGPHADESGTQRGDFKGVEGESWVATGAEVDTNSRVYRSVVEDGAVVVDGAEIDHSVLLPGARVGAGCRVTGSVLGPRVELQPGGVVKRQMVTVEDRGAALPGGATRIDGQVFTPIR